MSLIVLTGFSAKPSARGFAGVLFFFSTSSVLHHLFNCYSDVRTANRKGEKIEKDELKLLDLDDYSNKFAEVMKWVCNNIGNRVEISEEMGHKQHPRNHREFKE